VKIINNMSENQKYKLFLRFRLRIIYIIIFVFVTIFITRSLVFEKKFTLAIANETHINVPDLVIRIDNEEIFRDSIFISSIPCCWTNKVLSFGIHEILVESKSKNLHKLFSVFCFKDSHIYVGIRNSTFGKLWVDKRIYYFFSPLYQ
jgi:hypothetical protein